MKKGDVDQLLNNHNNVGPIIKFTMELEEDGSIPFLDTRVIRKVEGKLDITVYRKPMHAHGKVPALQLQSPRPHQEKICKVSLQSR